LQEKDESAGNSFIYTNWRGKQFIIDQKFVDELKEFLIEEGEDPKWLD